MSGLEHPRAGSRRSSFAETSHDREGRPRPQPPSHPASSRLARGAWRALPLPAVPFRAAGSPPRGHSVSMALPSSLRTPWRTARGGSRKQRREASDSSVWTNCNTPAPRSADRLSSRVACKASVERLRHALLTAAGLGWLLGSGGTYDSPAQLGMRYNEEWGTATHCSRCQAGLAAGFGWHLFGRRAANLRISLIP